MANYLGVTNLGFQFADGLENPSGIQEEVFLIPISHIKTEGKPVANGTTTESIATIATNHVLNATKSPIAVTALFNKSGANFKLAGEELSKIFETDVELFIPQLSAGTIGGAAAIKNMRFMILVKRPGQLTGFFQIGSKGMPAKVQDIAGGLGTGPTGEIGLKISLKAFDIVPMYEYTGELPITGV